MDDVFGKYVDVVQAGKLLGVHPETIKKQIRAGTVPSAFRFSNKWLIPRDAVGEISVKKSGRPRARPPASERRNPPGLERQQPGLVPTMAAPSREHDHYCTSSDESQEPDEEFDLVGLSGVAL